AWGLISRSSIFRAGALFSSDINVFPIRSGRMTCAPRSAFLEDIVELVVADQDGVVLLDALFHQRIQNAALAQLPLEELQALVVVHVAARQDALQPGRVAGPAVGLQPGDGEGAAVGLGL